MEEVLTLPTQISSEPRYHLRIRKKLRTQKRGVGVIIESFRDGVPYGLQIDVDVDVLKEVRFSWINQTEEVLYWDYDHYDYAEKPREFFRRFQTEILPSRILAEKALIELNSHYSKAGYLSNCRLNGIFYSKYKYSTRTREGLIVFLDLEKGLDVIIVNSLIFQIDNLARLIKDFLVI
jgi:hypothetical protein